MFACCLGGGKEEKKGRGVEESGIVDLFADDSSPMLPGQPMLPGCELEGILGEGTFGQVMLVRERSTGERFAVKIMSKEHLIKENQLENIT